MTHRALRRSRRVVRLSIATVALMLSTGLAACSPSGGQQTTVGQTATGTSSRSPSESPSAEVPELMPDYIGIKLEEAQRQLSQYNAQVASVKEISPAAPGTVIAQEPSAGQPFSQMVTLTFATEAPVVPDVAGMTFGEASKELRDAGFRVRESPSLNEKELDGLVLAQDPPEGTKNVGEVVLTVSRRPLVSYLSDMDPVDSQDSGLSTGTAKTDGEPYTHSVVMDVYQSGTVDYDLSRDYRKLLGTVGLEDGSAGDARYKVEIYGDRRNLFTVDVGLGEPREIDLDITDVLRLQLLVTRVNGDGDVVFADVRVLGLESEVQDNPSADASN